MAEKYYHLAIHADKSNVWPLCNYATFLWDVRHKFDDSEVVRFSGVPFTFYFIHFFIIVIVLFFFLYYYKICNIIEIKLIKK